MERLHLVKASGVPAVTGTLDSVTPKLEDWLQETLGTTPKISVQKSTGLTTAKTLSRTLKFQGLQ